MTEVQSGVRGYLLTGDDGFLDSYQRGLRSWLTHSARLGHLADGSLRAPVSRQQVAGDAWLRQYAAPVVAASSRPGGWQRMRTARDSDGARRLFEQFRTGNVAVDRRLAEEVEASRAHSSGVRRLVLVVLLVAGRCPRYSAGWRPC